MIKGHLTFNEHKAITGNRLKAIISIMETDSDNEYTSFLETYNFEPSDIMALMYTYGIDYKYSYRDLDDYLGGYDETIETETLIFTFHDSQFYGVYEKYNILDELQEKYGIR